MSATRCALYTCLFLVVALFAPLQAAELLRLAEVTVPVEDQSTSERNDALETALEEVLVRLSGSTEVMESNAASELLRSPSRFVQRFRYETRNVLADRGEGSAGSSGLRVEPEEKEQLVLHATFDIDTIERRLRSYGLPVWGRERPRTLVLMAVDDPRAGRAVIGDDHGLARAWRGAGQRRGIPLQLPHMDREDQGRIAVMDIWGVFEEPLLAAAERYDPNATLVVSAWPADGSSWAVRGTLLRDDEPARRWEMQGASLERAVGALVDTLAEAYAREFAVAANGGFSLAGNSVEMEIRDVGDVDGYARVVDYISGLSAVESVQVDRVASDRVHLEVELRGSREALEKAIALGRLLEPVRESGTATISLGDIEGMDFSQPAGLVYRYRR